MPALTFSSAAAARRTPERLQLQCCSPPPVAPVHPASGVENARGPSSKSVTSRERVSHPALALVHNPSAATRQL